VGALASRPALAAAPRTARPEEEPSAGTAQLVGQGANLTPSSVQTAGWRDGPTGTHMITQNAAGELGKQQQRDMQCWRWTY